MSTIGKILLTIGALFATTIIEVIVIPPIAVFVSKGGPVNGTVSVVSWFVIFGILMFFIWRKKK